MELAGALNDFGRGILADYPNLRPENLNVILVHSREHILPELSESLGRYAQEKMADRGVIFRLNARLRDFQTGVVSLSDGEIPAETLVWTAGTAPNPLLRTLPVERDKRGAVIVETTLAVKDHPGVWALGDCAAVSDGVTGKPCPPTAQFALREAQFSRKTFTPFGRDGLCGHSISIRSAPSASSDTRPLAPNCLFPSLAGSPFVFPACWHGPCGEESISQNCQG